MLYYDKKIYTQNNNISDNKNFLTLKNNKLMLFSESFIWML